MRPLQLLDQSQIRVQYNYGSGIFTNLEDEPSSVEECSLSVDGVEWKRIWLKAEVRNSPYLHLERTKVRPIDMVKNDLTPFSKRRVGHNTSGKDTVLDKLEAKSSKLGEAQLQAVYHSPTEKSCWQKKEKNWIKRLQMFVILTETITLYHRFVYISKPVTGSKKTSLL